MSEVSTVLGLSIFIGVIIFLSGSAVNSIPELKDLKGTENFQNYETTTQELDIQDYIKKDSVFLEDGIFKWDGTTNDRGENYGYIRYDIEGINKLTIDLYATLFSPMQIVIENSTNDVILTESARSSPYVFDASEIESETGQKPKYLEVRMDETFHEFRNIRVVLEGSGVISKVGGLVDVFTGLSSNTEWFNLIVGIPLTLAGIWLLLQIIKEIIPLT